MDRILRLTTPVIERIGAVLIMVPIQHTPLRHVQENRQKSLHISYYLLQKHPTLEKSSRPVSGNAACYVEFRTALLRSEATPTGR